MRIIAKWSGTQNPETDEPVSLRWANGNIADAAQLKRIITSSQSMPHLLQDGGVEYSYEVGEVPVKTEKNPYLTVTLTAHPPVRINKDEWEILASAEDRQRDNEPNDPNRESLSRMTVRQHHDGRTLVYGVYTYSTLYSGDDNYDIRGGEVLMPNQGTIIDAIMRVGNWMEEQRPKDLVKGGRGFGLLIHECISNLPAVDI